MSTCNAANVTCPGFKDSPYDRWNWPSGAPNPDVSGIGVLVGFSATAYLTLAIVGISYFSGHVSEEFLNSVDKGILSRKLRSNSANTWESTFRTAILMMSDQQIVTGIALLISGYVQLPCGLSAYHWQIIVYLAWFSSLTHLTTLTILRKYFRDNPGPRLWRTFLMLFMVTMLGIALLPTGDALWFGDFSDGSQGIPALCFFKRLIAQSSKHRFEYDRENTPSMLISMMVLFSGYLTRLIRLSKQATAFTKLWIRTKPGRVLKGSINDSIQRAGRAKASMYWRLKHLVLETVYVLLRAAFDIYESTIWEILWLLFAIAWGTSHISMTRASWGEAGEGTTEENTWGYGQVFPVVLLALPILSMGESYYEKKRATESESRNGIDSATQSQAGYNTTAGNDINDDNRSHFMRIGQWPAPTTPALTTPPIALETINVIRRTGTDLQNEEENAGTAHFRLHSGDLLQAENEVVATSRPLITSTAGNTVPVTNCGLDLFRDYYKFEWFWILIGMMVSITSTVIIITISALVNNNQILSVWMGALTSILFGLGSSMLYAGMFVVLMEYHKAIEKVGIKYAHIPLGLQHLCLRCCAYVYAGGVITYTYYMYLSHPHEKDRSIQEFKEVVGPIVLLARPLSTKSLAALLGISIEIIDKRLNWLHSVLNVPSNPETPVTLFHQLFREFLISSDLAKDFFVDKTEVHKKLHHRCLIRIIKDLKKDIYCQKKPETLQKYINKQVVDIHLKPKVQYAYLYWVEHFRKSGSKIDDDGLVYKFLVEHFLHWLEALSLLGGMSEGVLSITKLEDIIQEKADIKLINLVRDARRFIQYHKWVIENNPLQVYASALVFSPTHSLIREIYKREEPNWIKTVPVVAADWSACLQTLNGHSNVVTSVIFSHDSTKLASTSYDKTIKIWDPSDGKLLQTLNSYSSGVTSVVFSHDSTKLASVLYDHTIKIWSPNDGKYPQRLEGHSKRVTSVVFSPNSNRLASASEDKTIKIWNPSDGKCLLTLQFDRFFFSISFNYDSLLLQTETEAFSLDSPSASMSTQSTGDCKKLCRYGYGLSSDKTWITQGSENLLWLPSEHLPSTMVTAASTVAIGCSSGRVLMFKFAGDQNQNS